MLGQKFYRSPLMNISYSCRLVVIKQCSNITTGSLVVQHVDMLALCTTKPGSDTCCFRCVTDFAVNMCISCVSTVI